MRVQIGLALKIISNAIRQGLYLIQGNGEHASESGIPNIRQLRSSFDRLKSQSSLPHLSAFPVQKLSMSTPCDKKGYLLWAWCGIVYNMWILIETDLPFPTTYGPATNISKCSWTPVFDKEWMSSWSLEHHLSNKILILLLLVCNTFLLLYILDKNMSPRLPVISPRCSVIIYKALELNRIVT